MVEIVRDGRDINTTMDHIQNHTCTCVNKVCCMLHAATNNMLCEGEHTTIRMLERLEANLQRHKCKSVAVHHNSGEKVRDKILA